MSTLRNAFPRNSKAGALAFALLLPLACVTVNVTFPEATVQKASDDYVRDLYKAKEKGRATTPGATDAAKGAPTTLRWIQPTSHAIRQSRIASLQPLYELLVPSALAVEVPSSFRMDSVKIGELKKTQAARIDKIIAAEKAGQIGEGNDGKLSLDADPALKPMIKKALQPLVEAENKDRGELYEEVISLNSMAKGRLKDVQRTFSHSFQNMAPAGTWIQDEDGKWSRKK